MSRALAALLVLLQISADRSDAVADLLDFKRRPDDAVQLVGSGGHRMVPEGDVPSRWIFEDGVLTASPAWDSVMTPEDYADFRMHLEFNLNQASNDEREKNGNSGVYIQQRYEVQILDSHGVDLEDYQDWDCGSLYRLKKPDRLACKPAGEWQSFDIVFRAARFEGEDKVENARITVFQNDLLIHEDVALNRKTGAGKPEGPEPRPIKLQGHRNQVRFRNVWIEPLSLDAMPPVASDDPRRGGDVRASRDRLNFNRDVRPILSEHCFPCHGPDEGQRKAKLRLDDAASALAERGGGRIIVPGDVEGSELAHRVATSDASELMPPPEAGDPLSAEQVGVLQRWISEGAVYADHWAWERPVKPAPQPVPGADQNPIDAFILDRLGREGLEPSGPASRETLIRRVTLDLTGLPPTLEELDAFLADDTPGAYERLVDRLLAQPRTAERLTLEWLDAARYADTNGYSIDDHRDMWAWRDWVIGSFHEGKPNDRFIVEQLAGDLPPNAIGMHYFGTTQVQLPFGDSYRCVGGQTHRLNPPMPASAAGVATRTVDLTAQPAGGVVVPAATLNFQFWHRDPQAMQSGFSLTDAVSVSFQ